MKNYKSFAGLIMIVLLTAVNGGNSYAQTPTGNTENKIVEREANFTLKFVGEDISEVPQTLKAIYQTNTNKYSLQFVKDNEPIGTKVFFTYPLNYEYFSKEINNFYYDNIVKEKNSEENAKNHIISQATLESIFFWMYAMKGELEEKVPVAGKCM